MEGQARRCCRAPKDSLSQEAPQALLELLARPNIASKEWLIRQYDHEVQGTSVIKPLHTAASGRRRRASGPNDAARDQAQADFGCGHRRGLRDQSKTLGSGSLSHGSVRGRRSGEKRSLRRRGVRQAGIGSVLWWIISAGRIRSSNSAKCAALVRACYGMREAALALGAPLVSGKDSMKNDFRGKRERAAGDDLRAADVAHDGRGESHRRAQCPDLGFQERQATSFIWWAEAAWGFWAPSYQCDAQGERAADFRSASLAQASRIGTKHAGLTRWIGRRGRAKSKRDFARCMTFPKAERWSRWPKA